MESLSKTLHDFPVDRYRSLLRLHLRQLQLGRLYQARFDSSDVLQESLLRAVRAFDQVRGRQEAELIRWMQAIVKNVLVDFVRKQVAAKRDSRLEKTVCDAAGEWDTPLAAYLTASESGPGRPKRRVEHLADLGGQGDGRERLLQEVHPLAEHPVPDHRVVRVPRHE